LTKRGLSITYSYDEWYKVAYAISNTFTYEIGEKYYLSLCKIDIDKYNENKCRRMLENCYENSRNNINFNSLVYFANAKGFKTKIQREGVPKTATP
jgi:hypothetical protein